MALIGTIRKNGWILIVLMVLALGGFILMDIISNAQRYGAGDINTIGKVKGQEIKRSEFDTYEKLIYSNPQPGTGYQIRQQVWDYFVERTLLEKEAEVIGLGVSKEELMDLQFGQNLSPVILQRFAGADGQPNREQLNNIKNAIESGAFTDPLNRAYWATQEKEIITERLQEKIGALITKAIYAPTWQAEMSYRESNQRANFVFVRVPYDKVADGEVSLTDEDFEAYLKENPRLYYQFEETRTVEYVELNVYPSATDSAAAYEAAWKLWEGLRAAENDSLYAVTNRGTVDSRYRKKDDLPAAAADSLATAPVGTIVGPFFDQGSWVVAKIYGRKVVPDSVKARHILLRDTTAENEKKIDSLKQLLIDKKVSFDSLARVHSQDPGSAGKGGDLGWFAEGVMVPEFNAACFYDSEIGKYYKVSTQFGWHLIEVTGKKFLDNQAGVRLIQLKQPIEPGKETQQRVKDKALELLQQAKTRQQLVELAKKEGYALLVSQPLKANDYSLNAFGSGGEEAREIVRWAYDAKTKLDAVAQEIFSFRDPNGGYFDSKYVLVALKSIVPKGPATVATLRDNPRAEIEVRNRKKAELIKNKIGNNRDLNALSVEWGIPVDTAQNVTMVQSFLPSAGAEPRVVGAVFNLAKKDAVTKPIAGNSGVYVARLTEDIPQLALPPDLAMFRRQATSAASTSVRMNWLNLWRKYSDIDDYRSRFF